jgi:signal peptidase I
MDSTKPEIVLQSAIYALFRHYPSFWNHECRLDERYVGPIDAGADIIRPMQTNMKSVIRRVLPKPVVRGFIAEWAVTLIMLLFGTTSVLQAFVIPSGSMESTLLVGDHVLVDKLVYAPTDSFSKHLLPYRDVQRGDIIVFRHPLELNKTLVKRAIGVPGDRIRLENKRLILNGVSMDEPYANHIAASYNSYRDNFPSSPPTEVLRPRASEMLEQHVTNGELVVPQDAIFAMGDNRENSDDSRYWGLVPRENIVGTPFVIYWSFDAPSEDLSDPGIGAPHLIDVATHFFTKTRWARMFQFVRSYPLQRSVQRP